MKSLLVYLKGYYKETILSPLFKLVEALLELVAPLLTAAMIDYGIANRDVGYVVWMGLGLLGLGIVGLVSSVTAQYFAAKAAVGFGQKLRQALFAHILRFHYTEIDTVGASTLINRMTTDAQQVQTGVNVTLRLVLRSPFVVFGAMIMAFVVHAESAWVFVPLITVLGIVVAGIMTLALPRHRVVQGKLDKLFLHTRETLTGVRVLRAFGKEQSEMDNFARENSEFFEKQIRVGRLSALMNPLTFAITNGALVVLLWNGAIQVQAGGLTQGQVVALVNYLSQILVELIKFANLLVTMTKSLACAKRLEGVFAIEPSMKIAEAPKAENPESKEAVRFDRVSLRYAGAAENSLTEISFTALRGETIGVIGGTGSGKTTLVNLIPRFYDATEGSVCVGGVDVKAQALSELRGQCAGVPQKAALVSGTIRDNLCWGKEAASDEDIWAALHVAQAAELVREKQGGLEAVVEQGGRNFSGGQKQRLTIARALLKEAPVLILDDSASALDYATDAALRKALREAGQGRTVFIVSQRASSVRNADRILVLENGTLVGNGTHDELMADCHVYQEIYYSQYPKGA